MKILKSAVIAFSLAVAAVGSFSTVAVAEEGRTSFTPLDAVKRVENHITAAETAIANGADGADVAAHIKKAGDACKEINANDKVSRETSKVLKHLKAAGVSAQAANLQEAKEHLAGAREAIKALKTFI